LLITLTDSFVYIVSGENSMNDISVIIDEYERLTGIRLWQSQVFESAVEISQTEDEREDCLIIKTLYALPVGTDGNMGFIAFIETVKCLFDYDNEISSAEPVGYEIVARL